MAVRPATDELASQLSAVRCWVARAEANAAVLRPAHLKATVPSFTAPRTLSRAARDQAEALGPILPCPLAGRQHSVPASRMSRHVTHCALRLYGGLTRRETELLPPASPAPAGRQIRLTPALLANVLDAGSVVRRVPQTPQQWDVELGPAQRLAVYEWVMRHTAPPPSSVLPVCGATDEDSRPLGGSGGWSDAAAGEEVLAVEQRNLKRRRQAYRGLKAAAATPSSSHTLGRSYSEMLRQLIDTQMETIASEPRPSRTKRCRRDAGGEEDDANGGGSHSSSHGGGPPARPHRDIDGDGASRRSKKSWFL